MGRILLRPIVSQRRIASVVLFCLFLIAPGRAVQAAPIDQSPSAPAEAAALIEEAAAKIRANAYYAGRVDWARAIDEAKRQAHDAKSPGEAYPAIRWMLQQMRDSHSFLLPASRANSVFKNEDVDDIAIKADDLGDVVVVHVPGFVGTRPIREAIFATRLHDVFEQRHQMPRCGWVVDLRRNGGGNMFPMIAGLAPLLGTENLGRFVSHDKDQIWDTRGIYASAGMDASRFERPDLRVSPVAVLIGPSTMSAGEAVAIAFRGRPNARSFGAATAGKTTGNQGERLSDGSMLLIATALMADRNGNRFGGPLFPDEAAADGARGEDGPMAAALRWLRQRCHARHPDRK